MGPKKKKKQARNAFWFFMQDEMKKLGREGRTWNTMDELVQICSPRWNGIDPEEKRRYEHMAKKKKEEARLDLSNRFDQQGRSLQDIENERRDRERTEAEMVRDIHNTVGAAFKSGILVKEPFYFMHFNALCTTADGSFLPCEVSLCQFSLSGGCSRIYHAYVRPPPEAIPLGSAYNIMTTARDTHRLDLDSEPLTAASASDHSKIVGGMLDFLCDGDERYLPPIYTMKNDVEKVTQLLFDLFAWAGEASPASKGLRVYQVHELFFQLSRPAGLSILGNYKEAAQIKLESEEFLYSPGLACSYHEDLDRQIYCSRFAVRNWSYVISDTLCDFYSVDRVPGLHAPADPDGGGGGGLRPVILGPEPDREWRNDDDLYQCEEGGRILNEFGAPKTKAQPAGHTVPVAGLAAKLQVTRLGGLSQEADSFDGGDSSWTGWSGQSLCSDGASTIDSSSDYPELGAASTSRGGRGRDRGRGRTPTTRGRGRGRGGGWAVPTAAVSAGGHDLHDQDFPSLDGYASKRGGWRGRGGGGSSRSRGAAWS